MEQSCADPTPNFPTDSATKAKVRLKQLKEEGKTPERKTRIVEDHYDDLGDDLSGLVDDFAYLMADYVPEVSPYSDDSTDKEFADGLTDQYFFGDADATPKAVNTIKMDNWNEAMHFLNTQGSGIDLCELCGGPEARTSQIAIRRHMKAGRNFYLAYAVDLGDPKTQSKVANYINDNPRRAIGPPSNLNFKINPEAWEIFFRADLPHLEFCGKIAILQARKGRFWFAETSWPAWLWTLREWQHVDQNPTTQKQVIHQCRLGRRGPSGRLTKKPTEVSSNAPELMKQFEGLICTRKHEHDNMWGKFTQLGQLQLRSWLCAARVVQGIVELKKRIRHQQGRIAYTAYKGSFPCIGCDSDLPPSRTEHNRVDGEYKFHDLPHKIETKLKLNGHVQDAPARTPMAESDHDLDVTLITPMTPRTAACLSQLTEGSQDEREAHARIARRQRTCLRGP